MIILEMRRWPICFTLTRRKTSETPIKVHIRNDASQRIYVYKLFSMRWQTRTHQTESEQIRTCRGLIIRLLEHCPKNLLCPVLCVLLQGKSVQNH